MNDYKKDMGLRIKARRKKLLLTQEVVAEHLGISVKHFSEVEWGIAGLSIENLINLSNILGLSIDYIIKGDSNIKEWDSTLSILQNVPKEKEEQIKRLIRIGIDLINWIILKASFNGLVFLYSVNHLKSSSLSNII